MLYMITFLSHVTAISSIGFFLFCNVCDVYSGITAMIISSSETGGNDAYKLCVVMSHILIVESQLYETILVVLFDKSKGGRLIMLLIRLEWPRNVKPMPLKKGRFDISKRDVKISRLVKSSVDVVDRLYEADWLVFLREYIS